MKGRAGFTLVELMAVCALMSIFCAAAGSFSWQVRQADHRAAGYVSDLIELRAALRSLEADLRLGEEVTVTERGAYIAGGGNKVVYELHEGSLWRESTNGRRQLASRIAEMALHLDGPLVHVTLSLQRRAGGQGGQKAALVSTVGLRNRSRD